MKDRPYITCREFIDFIGRYLDEELTHEQRHEFERHLNVCPSCVAYLESYKETVRLGKLAFAPSEEPAPVPESLIRAIKAARTKGA